MWQTVESGFVSFAILCVGVYLRREANRVLRGGKPQAPDAFKELSRHLSGDYDYREYEKKKSIPENVWSLGWILIVAGMWGIVQTLWRAFAGK